MNKIPISTMKTLPRKRYRPRTWVIVALAVFAVLAASWGDTMVREQEARDRADFLEGIR